MGDCRRPGRTELLWVSALAGALLLSRLADIRFAGELGIDESVMLAQATRYAQDFMPWRGVDGSSSGPLNTWYLLLPHLAGMRLYYQEAHLLAALTWAGSTVACWLAARAAFGARNALAGAATMVVWFMCQQRYDFIYYTSETLPVLLLSLALVGAIRGGCGGYVAAGILGLVPWSKLQAAPIGAVIGAWMVARVLWPAPGQTPPPPLSRRLRSAALLIAAGLLPSIILVVCLARGGALGEMWDSYVVANLHYAGPLDVRHFFSNLLQLGWTWSIRPWFLGLLAIGAWRLARGRARARPIEWRGAGALAWMTVAASWYVCARPAIGYEHYQLLLLPGLALLTSATLAALGSEPSISPAITPCVCVALGAYLAIQIEPAYATQSRLTQESLARNADAKVVLARIEQLAPGRQPIVVWGWFPALYVESGRPPPTRFAIAHFLCGTNPSRFNLREKFMLDLIAEQPQVLLDTHRRNLDRWFGTDPIGNFPELEQYVRAHFAWSSHIDTPMGPIEVYVRKK